MRCFPIFLSLLVLNLAGIWEKYLLFVSSFVVFVAASFVEVEGGDGLRRIIYLNSQGL